MAGQVLVGERRQWHSLFDQPRSRGDEAQVIRHQPLRARLGAQAAAAITAENDFISLIAGCAPLEEVGDLGDGHLRPYASGPGQGENRAGLQAETAIGAFLCELASLVLEVPGQVAVFRRHPRFSHSWSHQRALARLAFPTVL